MGDLVNSDNDADIMASLSAPNGEKVIPSSEKVQQNAVVSCEASDNTILSAIEEEQFQHDEDEESSHPAVIITFLGTMNTFIRP